MKDWLNNFILGNMKNQTKAIPALEMAKIILDAEARRDSKGRLTVYKLPAGDGGGTFEVAGINDKYHKEQATRLKRLIESGQFDNAEQEAIKYIAKYTNSKPWHTDGRVEAMLMDLRFNRGPTGAAKIFQYALWVSGVLNLSIEKATDGDIGDRTLEASARIGGDELLVKLLFARDWYERTVAKRNESSSFWKGLVSRWTKTYLAVLKFESSHDFSYLGEETPEPVKPTIEVSEVKTPVYSTLPPTDTISELTRVFGQPGDESQLVSFEFPYPMKLYTRNGETVTKTRCHKKIKEPVLAALKEIFDTYGMEWIEKHGLNVYCGIFNHRKMRNGSSLSRHSFGIAIDLNCAENGLTTPWDQDKIGQKGYANMPVEAIEIFEKHGFLSGARMWRRDAQHFQYTK